MNVNTIFHHLAKFLLIGSLAAMALAFLELIAQFLGTSLIGNLYAAGRILELAAILLVPVIAITLREIRDSLQADR